MLNASAEGRKNSNRTSKRCRLAHTLRELIDLNVFSHMPHFGMLIGWYLSLSSSACVPKRWWQYISVMRSLTLKVYKWYTLPYITSYQRYFWEVWTSFCSKRTFFSIFKNHYRVSVPFSNQLAIVDRLIEKVSIQ